MSDKIRLVVTAGTQGWKTVIQINKNASIEDLFRKISEWNGVSFNDQRITFAARHLQSHKDGRTQYITDYKLEDKSQIFVVLAVRGGNNPEQTGKVLDDDVELTDAPDMITWDDDPEGKRAKMPCGHAIGPESLTAYCRSLLTAGKCQFICPYRDPEKGVHCGKIWEYFTIRKLAVLTSEEKEEFEKKLSQNYLRKACGIQECPRCTSFCIRKCKNDRRVVCLFCSKDGSTYEFCWYCLGEWSSGSSSPTCGNSACSGEDPRLKILREAKRKNIVGLDGCPSVRACPKCGMLISHTEACKHMVCLCGQKFCFICLKKAINEHYPCGTFNSHCTIAPIQDKIVDNDDNDAEQNEKRGVHCGKIWEYFTIRKLAVLTSEEKEEFEKKLSQNYLRKECGIQECPRCTSFCIRKCKNDRRVVCLFCSKDGSTYEFFWYCLGEWSSGSSSPTCGNSACSGEDPRLKILREAKRKNIVGLDGCPSVRACPKCGMLISHTEACKHMVCLCGQKFCFICLKKAINEHYPCGTFNSHCTIAPIQDKIVDNDDNDAEQNEKRGMCSIQ